MKLGSRVPVAVLAFVLTGCATAAKPQLVEEPSTAPQQMKVVFVPQCPVSLATSESFGTAAALAIATEVGGKVVANAVDALGTYLSASKEAVYTESTRMQGFASVQNGKLTFNKSEGCMIVVIARDFREGLDSKALTGVDFFPGRDTVPSIKKAVYEATRLAGPASLYAEFTMVFDGTKDTPKTAFAFQPNDFYYPSFVMPDSMRFAKKRDVLLKIELSEPGQATHFGAIDLLWTGVTSGGISKESVIRKKLPWHPLPAGLDDVTKAKTVLPAPIFPVNVKAVFTETANPHVILKYVGEALKAQKDTLATQAKDSIEQAVSKQARATARLAAAGDLEKKYLEYSNAYDQAKTAYDNYSRLPGTDAAAKQKALVAAKVAYARLAATQTIVSAIYANADLGAFAAFPDLPALD